MSQENVEIVGSRFPDVIVRTAEGWLEPEPYVGREAAMRFHEQLRDTWAGVAPHRGAILRGAMSQVLGRCGPSSRCSPASHCRRT